ncbi:14 kDa proline-rich protein DC2.15-like [Zingiber officinale]|uniref:14 kDa proline-rich protein DC2.15-like n=1 Tax=Zingiber officinale TaxID=94328 RepID=UPI001C4B9BFA|nr:14 kDa proline-rich protein DC2.15-like [Zingiber officinale]
MHDLPAKTNATAARSPTDSSSRLQLYSLPSSCQFLHSSCSTMGTGGSAPASAAGLFLALNLLLFFTLAGSCGTCPPKTSPKPSLGGKCPIDALKMAACSSVLNGLITFGIGAFPQQPCDCCTLIDGLLDLEAAVCLCTAFRANIFGVNLNVPINFTLLLNYCGKKVPYEFQCP